MLNSTLRQTSSFTKFSNVWAIVMSEHLVLQDSISNLRAATTQVHFEQLSLKITFFRFVRLECFKQESSSLLDAVLRHEELYHLIRVNEGSIRQLLSKLKSTSWVGMSKRLKHVGVVSTESDLSCISYDLVELSTLHHAVDCLLRNFSTEVDGKSHVHINGSNEITKLFTAVKLILLEPFLEELSLSLLQDWTSKLNRFELVQLATFKKNTEVLENWLRLSRLSRDSLETRDGIWATQDAIWRLSSKFCSSSNIALSEELLELIHIQVISSR
mmetsp:Transcript_10654/g.12937  ORF Transcript_10654/g.12937 Transcript_10654/m.12937 type:complete len:272 (-) Transcript_10654:1137-1952(-)